MKTRDYSLFNHFKTQFELFNDKIMLTTEKEQSYSFYDIDQETARLANYLVGIGAKPGDRVSAQVEKSPQALCLYLACLRAGLVYHPLNPAYSAHELDYFINNAEPAIIVCVTTKFQAMLHLAKSSQTAHILTLDADGTGTLIDNARDCSTTFEGIPRSKNDLAALLYSSGTTGVPKGIKLTHGNLLSNAKSLAQIWQITEEDHLLHCLPTFHVHGLFIALNCVLLSGASMRWLPAFKTHHVLKYLPESTVMMGVPTYYTRLLDDPLFTTDIARNIRLFISGSAPLKEETFTEFKNRTGHCILERYGMTETSINTSNPLEGVRKPGTVGLPLPEVDIRIVDDTGNPLATGEIGNLQVRGPNVFSGYWRMPEKTNEAFTKNRFFDTGDKGQIDADGYVSIVGRTKDLIISGGLNIYPKEIEILIDNLPGIYESAVIGVPHSDFGEAVVAVIVKTKEADLNEDQIITSLKSMIANFKVPKRIIMLEELPRNAMGKVQKNLLRQQYKDLLS
ncbi:MAG: malonyl-CoA synthase [Alphaproteobacteria bacterium]|nr:malonyl-CoA synthase [Alphaproteobacteria bacterium]